MVCRQSSPRCCRLTGRGGQKGTAWSACRQAETPPRCPPEPALEYEADTEEPVVMARTEPLRHSRSVPGDASAIAAGDLNDRDRVAVGIRTTAFRPASPSCSIGSVATRRGSSAEVASSMSATAIATMPLPACWGSPDDVQPAGARHLPHHFLVVCDDVRSPAEEAFVPRLRCLEVGDRDPSEQDIDVHSYRLARLTGPPRLTCAATESAFRAERPRTR
jgi:hypothetical protein